MDEGVARDAAGYAGLLRQTMASSSSKKGFSAVRSESGGIRAEMNTQFRWIMGGIGSAALALLVAVLAAILAQG